MLRLISIVFTALLLCSCAAHTQRIVVPSKKFSMIGPPSDWKTLIKTETYESPVEPYEKIPGGMFIARWSKNISSIGFAAFRIPDPESAMSPETVDRITPEIVRNKFDKDMGELRRRECRKDLEYSIESKRDRFLGQDLKMHELEASIICTSLRDKTFIKILTYMVVHKDGYLYSFELFSLQSDFSSNRKVLDAMIDSFTFMDQAPEKTAPASVTSAKKPDEFRKQDQVVKKTFIKIQEPDVVFAYGELKYTVNIGDTLEVIRIKTCRSGSDKCWIVKHVITGNTGAVKVIDMKSRHSVYSAKQPDLTRLQSTQDLPPRIFIEIRHPDKVYKGGKPTFTVNSGDILEVLHKGTCKSGRGECWGVQHMGTGRFGFVNADRMRSTHRVYTELGEK